LRKGLFGRYTFNPILTILFYKKKRFMPNRAYIYIYIFSHKENFTKIHILFYCICSSSQK